LINSISFLLSF